MLNIAPSIASSNQVHLEKTVKTLEEMNINNLHIDIEDGNFIPNITFGLKTIKNLREITDMPFSVHIMSCHPEKYIYNLAQIGVDSITVNIEVCEYPKNILNMIKDLKVKAGFAFNPKTSIEQILYMVHEIDIVLIMTAEPDMRSQIFIENMLDKVKKLSNINNNRFEIWADGGIEKNKFFDLYNAGVDTMVLGREVFKDGKIKENLETINKIISNLKSIP